LGKRMPEIVGEIISLTSLLICMAFALYLYFFAKRARM